MLPVSASARSTIIVNNQQSFDDLQNSLSKAIKQGETEICVLLKRATFIAKENHIRIQGINAPNTIIRIVGTEAVIIPGGQDYKKGDRYLGKISENSSWMCNNQDVKTWSDVYYSDGLVDVVDKEKKICRIKKKEPSSLESYGASHILIPHWYQSSIYKIDKIVDNYIYFVAKDLINTKKSGYNVHGDYYFGKKNTRFKLFNAKSCYNCLRIMDGRVLLPSGHTIVREGIVNQLISLQNCTFHSLEISGIKFWGNSYKDNSSAIYINNIKCVKLWLHNCEFRGIRSNVIKIESSPNVFIEENSFDDCYYYGVHSDNKSKNTVIKGNTFMNMGKRMQNTFCIVCRGENYIISGNKMTDFGYGGIGVGVIYNSEKTNPCYGIVENNVMQFTDSYMANIANYGIMDSGAIYVWTKNDGAIIRNNVIKNYTGMYSNRGIFCDGGAYNVQIYNNVITGITNSFCIDSYRVKSVERSKEKDYGIDRSNVNVVIRDNIVDGSIRFEAHEGKNNGCVKGANYFIMKKGGKVPKNTIKNIVNAEEDIPLEYVGTANGKLYITSQSYRKLKKSKSWKNLRKYVGKY